ncbi:3-deoxy-manno-octulosonate-8-phosphatase, partial [Vibrio cholerae]
TLVKGNRWRANNPQVIQLGLGTKNMARNMLKVGLVVDIAFAIAINAVDVYVHDEKTMEDLVGRSGVDIVKGVVATGAGTLIAVIFATAGAPVLVSGLLFAGVSVGMGVALDWVDNELGVSDSLVDLLKKGE